MTSYISPFASFRHLLALQKVGQDANVMRMIQRLWVHMAESDPTDVFWEKVSPKGVWHCCTLWRGQSSRARVLNRWG